MSCGLKALTLFRKDQPISLTGTHARASSQFPNHEPSRLIILPAQPEGGGNPSHPDLSSGFSCQLSASDLASAKARMANISGRKLDLAVVVYSHQLMPELALLLKDVDTVLFWTWKVGELNALEANFRRLKEILPDKKVFLVCWLWDFENSQTLPIELMQKQSELGLEWLRAGEIEGIIFLNTNIMDKNLETVKWTREWIAQVGGERLQ